MRRSCDGGVDSFNLVFAIKACIGLVDGMVVHGLAVKSGLDKDAYAAPSFVEMYAQLGDMKCAQNLFEEIPVRNSLLWGVLMKGYLMYSQDSQVFRLFYLMRDALDALTLICLVKACGNVLAGKEDCWTMLEQCLNQVLIGMWQMLEESIPPNQCTLAALSSLGSPRQGKSLHGYMVRNEIEMDAVNFTSLIDMYARCGNIQMAMKVFDMMPETNVISWSSMINAFGINGMFEEALDCFDKMKSQNLFPNSVTFVSLLSACSHSGNVKEGWKHFESMTRDYKITPEEEHYACMVDLLGRAGQIKEAKSFIENMPVKPMASAWGALLSACRVHKEVHLAEEIAEKLLSMEADESSVYVLLSNIYADAGMWDMVNCMRRKMGIKGHRKPMALSATEVN